MAARRQRRPWLIAISIGKANARACPVSSIIRTSEEIGPWVVAESIAPAPREREDADLRFRSEPSPERAERSAHQGARGERRREEPARRAAGKAGDGAERPDRQQQDEAKGGRPRTNSVSARVLSVAERFGERDRNEPEAGEKHRRWDHEFQASGVGRLRSARVAIAPTNATDARPTIGEATRAQRQTRQVMSTGGMA